MLLQAFSWFPDLIQPARNGSHAPSLLLKKACIRSWTRMACRWLTKRIPGFTELICNATSAHPPDNSHLCDTKSAATWLVAQLPKLCSASTSTFKLHLVLETGKLPHILAHVQSHVLANALLQPHLCCYTCHKPQALL